MTVPAEVDEPSYVKLDLNDTPVVNLAVVSVGTADPTRLYRVADERRKASKEAEEAIGTADPRLIWRLKRMGTKELERQTSVEASAVLYHRDARKQLHEAVEAILRAGRRLALAER